MNESAAANTLNHRHFILVYRPILMDIKPPRSTPPTLLTRGDMAILAPSNKPQSANWPLSTLIEAIVLQKTLEGKLFLDLKGIQVEVADPPPLNFEKGQRWLLQLIKNTPLPVFKILHALQAETEKTVSIQQALRTVAPKQQPIAPLLANISALVQQIKTTTSSLPQNVQQAIQNLYQKIPQLKELQQGGSDPQRLKEMMHRIAPILESELAALSRGEPSQATTSVRTQLLRLAAILQPTSVTTKSDNKTAQPNKLIPENLQVKSPPVSRSPLSGYSLKTELPLQTVRHAPQTQPQVQASLAIQVKNAPEQILFELGRQVESALARGQVQQLNSLHAEQQGRPMWAMELPLRTDQGIDLFDVRIERDTQHAEEYSEVMPWSITLAFDLHGLGPVRAVVSLRGDQISTRFWAEQPETNVLFNQHLDMLQSRLRHAGINVGKLECQCGFLPEVTEKLEPVLLDEQV